MKSKFAASAIAAAGLWLGGAAVDHSYAQEAEVNAVAEALHAGLGSLDTAKIEPLWAHDASVVLINPNEKSFSVGWEAVKADWDAFPGRYADLKVTQVAGPFVTVKGDVAWRSGIASSSGHLKSGAEFDALVVESDIFEKRDGKWLLVSHIAQRAPK